MFLLALIPAGALSGLFAHAEETVKIAEISCQGKSLYLELKGKGSSLSLVSFFNDYLGIAGTPGDFVVSNEEVMRAETGTLKRLYVYDTLGVAETVRIKVNDTLYEVDVKLKDSNTPISATAGGCSWVIDNNGVMTISVTPGKDGVLPSFNDNNAYLRWPWYGIKNQIKKLVVNEGVKAGQYCTSMFLQCQNMTEADVSKMDVSGTKSLIECFSGCTELTKVNVTGWNTKNVTNMNRMFSHDSKLQEITGISDWDVSNLKVIYFMFNKVKMDKLELKWKNCTKINDVWSVFEEAEIGTLDISTWNLSEQDIRITTFMYDAKIGKLISPEGYWDVTSSYLDFYLEIDEIDLSFVDLTGISGAHTWYLNSKKITLGSKFKNYNTPFDYRYFVLGEDPDSYVKVYEKNTSIPDAADSANPRGKVTYVQGNIVSFDAGDGTGEMAPQLFPYGQEEKKLRTFSMKAPDGKRFLDWNTKADGSGKTYTDSDLLQFGKNSFTTDMTLYARYTTEADYTVQYFYENSGKYDEEHPFNEETRTGKIGTEVSVTENDLVPEKENYIPDEAMNSAYSGTVTDDGKLVLKVYFKQQFQISYEPGEHGTWETVTTDGLSYGDETPEFSLDPDKNCDEGYEFAGWSPEVNGFVDQTMTYTAQWKQVAGYSVEYYYQIGGEYSDTPDRTDVYTGAVDSTVEITEDQKKPEKEGYEFDEDADNILEGVIDPEGSLVLKVYFREIESPEEETAVYTVEYYYQMEGKYPDFPGSTESREGKVGDKVSVNEDDRKPQKENYIYDEKASNVEEGTITSDGKLVLKVYFAQQFDITFDPNGGTINESPDKVVLKATNGETIVIIAAPEREGYKFLYWKGSEYQPGDAYTVDGDHTFTAQWELIEGSEEGGEEGGGGETPKTGDNTNLTLWLVSLTLSAAALIAAGTVILVRKRKENN